MDQHPDNKNSSEKTRVAIGLSGGVDSAVAAALLQDQGYEVIGFTLHMFKEGSRCCSIEDVNRARRICDHLGMKHYVMNVMDRFMEEVVQPFTDAYASGTTPNPCIYCNRLFKFGTVLERALQLGCSHMATGHYVKIEQDPNGKFFLRRGLDTNKDQSYFLHRLTQHQLAHALFPLGGMTKPEVRQMAKDRELPTQGARETADLCFITEKGPAPLIERFHPEAKREGHIVNTDGKELGKHKGIHQFTIGQRGGTGVATGERVYVKNLDPQKNTITVATREELMRSDFSANDVYWMKEEAPENGVKISVRTRYRQKAVTGTLTLMDGDRVHFELDEPVFAITPGQAAVFYDDDEVLGGAWIERATEEED